MSSQGTPAWSWPASHQHAPVLQWVHQGAEPLKLSMWALLHHFACSMRTMPRIPPQTLQALFQHSLQDRCGAVGHCAVPAYMFRWRSWPSIVYQGTRVHAAGWESDDGGGLRGAVPDARRRGPARGAPASPVGPGGHGRLRAHVCAVLPVLPSLRAPPLCLLIHTSGNDWHPHTGHALCWCMAFSSLSSSNSAFICEACSLYSGESRCSRMPCFRQLGASTYV